MNPKVVAACTVVLSDWEQIPIRVIKSAVTLLHRIAFGSKMPVMLFQVKNKPFPHFIPVFAVCFSPIFATVVYPTLNVCLCVCVRVENESIWIGNDANDLAILCIRFLCDRCHYSGYSSK